MNKLFLSFIMILMVSLSFGQRNHQNHNKSSNTMHYNSIANRSRNNTISHQDFVYNQRRTRWNDHRDYRTFRRHDVLHSDRWRVNYGTTIILCNHSFVTDEIIIDNVVMVPLCTALNQIGATYEFSEDGYTTYIRYNNLRIEFQQWREWYYINGDCYELSETSHWYGGQVWVPLEVFNRWY